MAYVWCRSGTYSNRETSSYDYPFQALRDFRHIIIFTTQNKNLTTWEQKYLILMGATLIKADILVYETQHFFSGRLFLFSSALRCTFVHTRF